MQISSIKDSLITGIFLSLAMLISVSGLKAAQEPVVIANGEELRGDWADDAPQIAAFKGIPFASPPVGDLRWRSPKAHAVRSGPQDATQFAPACMQTSSGVDWYVGVAETFGHPPNVVGRPTGVSEDCLYLNVWTPALDAVADLPVMVFIHGGSNTGGWSYEPNYMGTRLAARGVVVVSISYRLGAFGFFSHPALSQQAKPGDPEAIANFALLDIRQGFQWVHDHIRAFGGDGDNITAFGESAGSFDFVDLLSIDLAAGKGRQSLFRRSISQSIGGSLVDRQTLEQEQATGVLLMSKLGLGAEVTAQKMREIAAGEILAASQKLPAGHYFDAVIDGRTMLRRPVDSFYQADTNGIDFLGGTNRDEWFMYVNKNATNEDVRNWIEARPAEHRSVLLAETSLEPDPRKNLDRLRTAQRMLCPTRYLAEQVEQGGGRAWVYYFTRQRDGTGGEKLGVYHGTELPYVFDMHDDWLPTTEKDEKLTQAVMDYWVQFAKTGNPNLDGRPAWPEYSRQNSSVMELGERLGKMGAFEEKLCDLLGPAAQSMDLE
jgi:para-nitrobenzyl esterase